MTKEKKPSIYQANPLIESRKPMNTLEMRLFLLALQNVNPHISKNDKYYDKSFRELHLTPSEVKEIFGHGEYLHRLEQVCQKLAQRTVAIHKDNGDFTYYSLFGFIRYEAADGLRIKFNEDMRPLILDILESGYPYTKIDMKQIFQLSSAYAMRLLELMLQYRGLMTGTKIVRSLQVEDIRFYLNVPDGAYSKMQDFKRRVLDAPIQEINQKTQYILSYESIKKGRKITGFVFTMDCSGVLPESVVKETMPLEMPPNKKDWHGLTEKAVNQLTILCGSNAEYKRRMDYAVELAKTRKVKNVPAFLYKAVRENYLKQDQDMKAAVEREFKAKQENASWELDAIKMFGDKIALDVEETPFDQSDDMGRAMVDVVKKALEERHLNVTAKRLLEDHGMTVARFIELYC